MRFYKAFYRGKTCIVEATSSYHAQGLATVVLKARRSFDVAIVLVDVPLATNSL